MWHLFSCLLTNARNLQVCRAQVLGKSSPGAAMPDLQTPQDMIKVFAETQKNMMELNR